MEIRPIGKTVSTSRDNIFISGLNFSAEIVYAPGSSGFIIGFCVTERRIRNGLRYITGSSKYCLKDHEFYINNHLFMEDDLSAKAETVGEEAMVKMADRLFMRYAEELAEDLLNETKTA